MIKQRGKQAHKAHSSAWLLCAAFLLLVAGCDKQPSTHSPIKDPARQASICSNQLKMYNNAKKLWAEEKPRTTNDTPTFSDLAPYLEGTANCPGGGTYTLGPASALPVCSIPEHQAAFLKKIQPAPTKEP